MTRFGFALTILGLLILSQRITFAGYIDPNTGGIIFQALAGAFAVISGFVLMFAGRIRMWWARLRRKRRGDVNSAEDASGNQGDASADNPTP